MLINLWLSGIELWFLEEILVRVVSNLLYLSLGTISRKRLFLETVLHFHLSHLTRKKKFKFRRTILGEVVKNAFYAFRRTLSVKPILFPGNFIFSSILEFETKVTRIIFRKFRNFLYTEIYLSSRMSYPKFFSLKEKIFPSFLFGFWQTKFQNAK